MKLLLSLMCATVFCAQVSVAQDGDTVRSSSSMDSCRSLPSSIKVLQRSRYCGRVPTVILQGSWRRSFSAAFRWDDGSSDGQDRNPNSLWDGSASSSPYKTQRRIRKSNQDVLCYGNFLNGVFPAPEQLTIKRSIAPRVDRFCVGFVG